MLSLSREKIQEGLGLRLIMYMYRCDKILRLKPYTMKILIGINSVPNLRKVLVLTSILYMGKT